MFLDLWMVVGGGWLVKKKINVPSTRCSRHPPFSYSHLWHRPQYQKQDVGSAKPLQQGQRRRPFDEAGKDVHRFQQGGRLAGA